uniref:Outer capsid glycoprotein VP7 n=1 Tax=Ruddy turnstone rotavirus TaxID=2212774 RepID=A0A3G1RPH3_9REOV|nr:MAG: viral structural protein 7 [Ruddy turnstone rotavirus]
MACTMFRVMLLSFALCINAQLTIKPINKKNICFMHTEDLSNSGEKVKNFTNIFSTYSDLHIEFIKYEESSADVVKILSDANTNECEVLAIHIKNSDLDFVSFVFSQNECQKMEKDRIHYTKLEKGREFFIYGKEVTFCPLSDNLIGMNCDTQLNATYFPVTQGNDYEVIDVPEFTNEGYVFYSQKQHFYICERVSANAYKEVYLFYKDSENYGTLTQRVNWGNIWTHFKTFAQVVYKVLDIFFGKRNLEPRM